MHALDALPGTPPAVHAACIERCLADRQLYPPPCHPATAFCRKWLARALRRQAAAAGLSSSERELLHARSHDTAALAVDELARGYGAEHPTVLRWQEDLLLDHFDRCQAVDIDAN